MTATTRDIIDAPPPADTEAERALIGSILVDPSIIQHVGELVRSRDFADEAHRIIFEHAQALHRDGRPVDVILLVSSLKHAAGRDSAAWEEIGGADYLAKLIKSTPTAANWRHYANSITEAAAKFRIYRLGERAIQAAHNGKASSKILDELRGELEFQAVSVEKLQYRAYTAEELDKAEIDVEYLVDGVLASKHVGGIIGASKSLKTTIAADLAWSVATAGKFLGYFPVLRMARTAFMSGESGLPTLQETLRRIARAAGRELRDADHLIISDQLPQLGNPEHMTALRRFIEQNGIEFLTIDPLYLCADTAGREGSLFAMGALLRSVAEVATDCGTTLLILHHMTQGSAKTSMDKNPELFDSAWAGTQQFFRQWIAINRRSAYDPEQVGRHELRLVSGGSMGHATGVALDIEEGSRTDPGGRRWDVTVRALSEVRAEQRTSGEAEREQRKESRFTADCELVRRKLDAIFPEGATKRDLRAKCQFSGDRIAAVLAELDESGDVVACEVTIGKRKYDGVRTRKEPNANDLFPTN